MPLTRLPLTTGVSGTLAAGNGGTGVTSADEIGNLVKLEDINVTSTVSSVEINIDYSGYTAFKLVINHLEKTGTSSSNLQFRVKRDGQSTFDSGSNTYGNQGILYDTAATRNDNSNVTSIAVFASANTVQKIYMLEAIITGAQETDKNFIIQGINTISDDASGTNAFGGARQGNKEKVTDIQITDTAQNIAKCVGTLYGVKS